MKPNKDSELIAIPKGYPFWYEPMMENLYILERLAKAGGGEGGGQTPPNVQEQIDKIKEDHIKDISVINMELGNLNKIISGDSGGQVGLISKIVALEERATSHEAKLKNIDKNTESIEGVKESIKVVSNTVNENQTEINKKILTIYAEINKLKDLIGTGGEGGDLGDVLAQIETIQKSIKQIQSELLTLSDRVQETESIALEVQEDMAKLNEVLSEMKKTLQGVETQIEVHTQQIIELGSAILSNAKSIDRLEDLVVTLENGIKGTHHIVNTKQEMEAITQKKQGSLCFVRNIASMFIWDGQWSAISSSLDLKEVGWDDIVGAPESSPAEIDKAVKIKHTHGNKDALDLVTHSKINDWDSKAGVGDVPTKLSELENDIGAGGNYDEAIATINKSIGKIGLLSTNEKSDLVSAINEINAKVQSVTDLEKLVLELSEKVAYLER